VAQAAMEAAPYGQDDYYNGFEHETLAVQDEPKAKSRKGLIAAAAALLVVGVGGVLAWGLGGSSGDGTKTPVIEASTDPVKEAPEDPGGKVIPYQNNEVYDRIAGSETDEGPSNMMPATEKPLAMTKDGHSPRVISLSGGESSVAQSGDNADGGGAVSPKKVRTVVVRPDGSFVTSSDATNPGTDVASVDREMMAATPSEQAMSQSFGNGVDGATGVQGGASSGLPRAKPPELVALQAQQRAAAPVVQQPAVQTQVPAASTGTGPRPLSLVPPTSSQPAATRPVAQQPAVSSPATSSGGGGYTVQVTSQRTPEQARTSYSNIQSRLPGVLSGYQPDIKMANLGDRGTFYRVRVGSFASRDEASRFCQSIKSAGGDCLVARK
jgi:cell division protein FtsN